MKKTPAKHTEPWVYLAGAGGVFLTVVLVLMLVTLSPEPRKIKQIQTRQVTIKTAKPEAVVNSFLTQVHLGEVDPAYRLLSERIRAKLPPEVFRERLRRWSSDEKHRWELRFRRVESATVETTSARVYISSPPREHDWTWHLIKAADGWKIDRLEGLPVESVRD